MAAAVLAAVLLAACGGSSPASSGRSSSAAASSSKSAATSSSGSSSSRSGSTSSKSLQTVKIGAITASQVPNLPYYVAMDTGIFAKEGLKVSMVFGKAPTMLAALSKNDVQFLTIIDTTANCAEKGLGCRIAAVYSTGLNDTIVGAKGVKSVSQLKGQRFVNGSSSESSPGRAVANYLQTHGLPAGSVHILYAPSPAAVALLTTGKVSGIMTDSAEAIKLQDKGYPTLVDLVKAYDIPSSGVGTTLSEIQHHPALVKKVVQAVADASKLIINNESAVLPVMEKRYALSQHDANLLWKDIRPTFNSTGRAPASGVTKLFQADKRDLKLKAMPTVSQVFDYSLLPSG